jgi:hypothetical protein
MRSLSLRLTSPETVFALFASLAVALVLAVPTAANAESTDSVVLAASEDEGPKVDETVALLADEADSSRVPVIAYGADPMGALERIGATEREPLPLLDAARGAVRAGEIDQLGRDPAVSYVVVDSPVDGTDLGLDLDRSGSGTSAFGDSDSESLLPFLSFPLLTTLYPQIDQAPAAWQEGFDGSGIGIAVIDSGVTPLTDFGSRVTQVRLASSGSSLDDAYGHGTFVAGVAAGKSEDGRYVGIAPGAHIYSLNVARGDGVFTSDIIAGLNWVYTNRSSRNIRVVVLSLGETLPSSYQTSALDAAAEVLWRAGVVVVVSAGNAGPDTAQYAPANDPFVITVGASDPNGTLSTFDDVVASFSTYGQTLDGFMKPDLVAPGRHVIAPNPAGSTLDRLAPLANHVEPGYLRMNGTSFSAPQVAGAVAILLQHRPQLTPDQVKWLLRHTARPGVSDTPGGALDLAGMLAYSGLVGYANQGIAPSAALSLASRSDDDDSGELNSAAAQREKLLERAAAWERIAGDRELRPSWKKAASAWEQAASYFNRAAAWERAAAAWERAAAAWEHAGNLTEAAEAWEVAAGSRSMVKDWFKAAAAWEKATAAWERTAAWEKAQAAAWERAAAWEKAVSYDAAAWESAAAWEAAAAWEQAAAWENAGDWENAGGWE